MANGKITLGKQSGGTLGLVFPDGVSNTEVVLPESGKVASVDTTVTDNAIARYDGTTGKLQNSVLNIYDSGNTELLNPSPELGENKITISRPNVTGNYAYMALLAEGVGSQKVRIGSSSSYVLSLETNNAEKARIDVSGNLLLTSGTGALGYGEGAGGTVTQLTSKSTSVTLNKPTGQITMNNAALAAGASVVFTLNNSIISGTDTVCVDWNNGNYRITPYGSAAGSCAFIVQNVSAGSLSDALSLQFNVIKGATA